MREKEAGIMMRGETVGRVGSAWSERLVAAKKNVLSLRFPREKRFALPRASV